MIEFEIQGLDKILARLDNVKLARRVKVRLNQALIIAERDAKIKSPADTGRLRSSIGHEVRDIGQDIHGVIGTAVKYGGHMEFGTGRFYEGPGQSKGSHWPPAGALDVWAQRHGFSSGYVVARIIGMRGGLRPRRFLRRAIEENRDRIIAKIQLLADDVAKYIARGG